MHKLKYKTRMWAAFTVCSRNLVRSGGIGTLFWKDVTCKNCLSKRAT